MDGQSRLERSLNTKETGRSMNQHLKNRMREFVAFAGIEVAKTDTLIVFVRRRQPKAFQGKPSYTNLLELQIKGPEHRGSSFLVRRLFSFGNRPRGTKISSSGKGDGGCRLERVGGTRHSLQLIWIGKTRFKKWERFPPPRKEIHEGD